MGCTAIATADLRRRWVGGAPQENEVIFFFSGVRTVLSLCVFVCVCVCVCQFSILSVSMCTYVSADTSPRASRWVNRALSLVLGSLHASQDGEFEISAYQYP